MRGIVHRLFHRHGKKAWLFVGLGALVIAGIGGGAYAALGGVARPQASSDIELQRGLVGWWKLDGNAKDATPYGQNGAIAGTTNVADRKNKANGALSFSNSSDSVKISNFDSNVLSSSAYSASWSLSIWAKAVAFNTKDNILLGKPGCNGGIVTRSDGTPGYAFEIYNAACTASNAIVWNVPDATTAWHLITATYSNGNMTLYGDGSLVGTGTAADMNNYGADLFIGGFGVYGGSFTFTGALDDARVYNRVLSDGEVKALYAQYSPGIRAASGESGLVGWWKFDGNAKDTTPYADNGTVTGASLGSDEKNTAKAAYVFNGTTDYIDVPDSPHLDFGTGDFVFVVKVKVNATSPGAEDILYKDDGTTGYGLQIRPDLSLQAVYGNAALYTTSPVVTVGQWYTLAMVRSGTNISLYVNGNSVASGTSSLSATNTLPLTFGRKSGGGEYCNCTISDIRAYSRALSASEISAIGDSYNSQINLNSNPTNAQATGNINSGLIAYWAFNGNAKDSTPYGDNGTVNGATLTTDREGRTNSAYSFSGSAPSNVTIPDQSQLDSTTGSWSFWFKAAALPAANAAIVAKADASNSLNGITVYQASNGDISVQIYNSSTSTGAALMTGVATGRWHHVVLVFNGNNPITPYFDGIQGSAISTPTGWAFKAGDSFGIGQSADSFWKVFNGSVDEMRVYNRDLSASEVQTLYNSTN